MQKSTRVTPAHRPLHRRLTQTASLLCALALLSSCRSNFSCKMPVSDKLQAARITGHALSLHLEPDSHHLTWQDSLFYTGTLTRFEINAGLTLESLRIGKHKVPLNRLEMIEPQDPTDPSEKRVYLLSCSTPKDGPAVLKASGKFWQDPLNVRFGHENVGGEMTATLGSEGAWFSSGIGFLASTGEHHPATHRLHASLPTDWQLMTQGREVRNELVDGRRHITWDESLPTDGQSIQAGPYDVQKEMHGAIELSTWFLRRADDAEPFVGHMGPVDDEAVKATLMRMNHHYLDLYAERIGTYPFSKFAVVEAFFPAGYGMPSWTLLGSQVIRMPYIPYTSLGHELLHNYWGNGVFVDSERGNWCEGITVFGADYLYKVQKGEAAAATYRRNALKDYRSYVHDGGIDLPLSAFRNRHDGATRAIGYGKAMMLFVMLEDLLGKEAYLDAERRFYTSYLGQAASWTDFLSICEEIGGLDLERFGAQWLDVPGAPDLRFDSMDWADGVLSGQIRQAQEGRAYECDLPLYIETHEGEPFTEILYMDEKTLDFEISCPEPRRAVLDKDCRIFRLLDPLEMEPVISQSFAESKPLFVAPQSLLEQSGTTLDAFACGLRGLESSEWISWEAFDPAIFNTRSVVIINPPALPEGLEKVDLRLSPTAWTLMGESADFTDKSLILATRSRLNNSKGALMIWVNDVASLAALARKLPHYGKYSALAFTPAGQNQWKANLQPKGSPLEKRLGSW
jgi:aminopeptidase N